MAVALEIYRCNTQNEPVWFSKLTRLLDGKIDKNTISAALDTLSDWMIIKSEYGESDPGKATTLYVIDEWAIPEMKHVYETVRSARL